MQLTTKYMFNALLLGPLLILLSLSKGSIFLVTWNAFEMQKKYLHFLFIFIIVLKQIPKSKSMERIILQKY